MTVGPGRLADLSNRLRTLPGLSGPQLREMIGWLQTTMGVLQATVGAADFLNKAAEALVQIVGLEIGRVLRLNGDEWTVDAAKGEAPAGDKPWRPSRRVLEEVRDKKKTFWQHGRRSGDADTPSLAPLQTVVAAPLLDAEGAVVGALYGERRRPTVSPLHGGEPLEAALVDLLACGVAAGLARQDQERHRLKLEQFFGADLAGRLVRDETLLDGREAGVTLLFCDVRGFSGVSEKLGPAGSLKWMNDVMTELSGRVLDERGVLVDYVGDEVMAMWGAPEDQPDQAERAVRSRAGHARRPAGRQRALADVARRGNPDRHRRQHRPGPGRQHWVQPEIQVRPPRQHRQPRQPRPGPDQVPPAAVAGDAGRARTARRRLHRPPRGPGARRQHRGAGRSV